MMSTKDKRNAYRIRSRVDQAIFRELIEQQAGDLFKGTLVARFDRPMLSTIAGVAAKAVMRDERLNVVLKKEKP